MPRWRVSLTLPAERDLSSAVEWSAANFGLRQADRYRDTVVRAITALAAGPHIAGSRARDAVRPGLRSIHVARAGRRGRHLLLYRVLAPGLIEVVRILHDAMDPPRHLPDTPDSA